LDAPSGSLDRRRVDPLADGLLAPADDLVAAGEGVALVDDSSVFGETGRNGRGVFRVGGLQVAADDFWCGGHENHP
jgi:hypothetical protein